MIAQKRLLAAILRSDLTSFIVKSFHHLSPNKHYSHNWHIETIAEHLTAACEGQIKRLIISMPPRSLKSICANVAWSAWIMGHRPESRIITASYSRELSIKHLMDCRSIINASWYRELFVDFAIDKRQNSKIKFKTTLNGFCLATSVDGTITGEGADYIILDDPQNPAHVFSAKRRAKAIEWFERVVMSRLDDRKVGVIVLIMQRLHKDDLAGWLLTGSGSNHWTELSLPMVAYRDFQYGNRLFKQGEVLHQARYSECQIQQIKQEAGSYVFAAQYMQRPIDIERSPIKLSWLSRYTHLPTHCQRVASWDTSAGVCYSAGSMWMIEGNKYFLCEIVRGRWDYGTLRSQVIASCKKWHVTTILIENKSSGQQLLQDLPATPRTVPINPTTNKLDRLMSVAPLFERGCVLLPDHASWLADLEYEMLTFPDGDNDDQVDSITQFLNWMSNSHTTSVKRLRAL